MKLQQKFTASVLLLALCGCATLPAGPSVNVLPAAGKSFESFQNEDAACRQWAERQTGMPTQETYDRNVATGAVAGTAVGAGLGAAIGSASRHAGAGALIGAASGLLVGAAVGSGSGQNSGWEAQRRYDNAYVQCMYSYGNQVPGQRVRATAVRPVAAVPPPPPPPVTVQEPVQPDDATVPPPDTLPPPPDMAPVPEQYSTPPEIHVEAAPQFIYSPALNLYVAVGVPYDLVYTGSGYFYFYGGRWFSGPYYNGPWVFASRSHYPPALYRYRVDRIRGYRDIEYRRYERDRAHFDGRFHRPVFRGERRR